MFADRPVIVCLTPIKNEAWILDIFLQSASCWADYIIIADQLSDDGSREICLKYKKVILVENSSETFNESGRQKLLLNEARKIQGKKLLITLDADEILSGNFYSSSDWLKMFNAEPGTTFTFDLMNIKPGFTQYWKVTPFFWGYVDDGREHLQDGMHTRRIPYNEKGNYVHLDDIKIMHYQFTDWGRMNSKHTWYQCYELIKDKKRSAIWLYRTYNHMYAIPQSSIKKIPQKWFNYYESKDINIKGIELQHSYRWDEIVSGYFENYGPKYFEKLAIWEKPFKGFSDPRSAKWKIIHWYLKKTQPFSKTFPFRPTIKLLDKILLFIGI